MSDKALILSYDRPAPRYTSYPPATQFHERIAPNAREKMLASIADDARISLYLHIPFCHQLCYYCGCFTNVTRKQERITRYLNALTREIQMTAQRLGDGVQLGHLHFGGGSPTMLSADDFRDLMHRIRACFTIADDAEIAIEVDPRQLNEAKVAAYAQCGVNRMSFGVQDLNQQVLKAVNRVQSVSTICKGVQLCRDYGISHINFDLMYGLPHQTVESITQTIALASTFAPTRMAFFGYAYVPWMKKHMQALDMNALPDASLRYDLFKAGCESLQQQGYHPVGIDHFVRKQDPMFLAHQQRTLHRNFQGYTTDAHPTLIGLGASAISHSEWGYVQNKAEIAAYENALEQGDYPPLRGWVQREQDATFASVIEEIMCYFEVDLARFAIPSALFFAPQRKKLQPLIEDGIIHWNGDQLRILKEPQLTARLVASAFDRYTPWAENNNEQRSPICHHARAV